MARMEDDGGKKEDEGKRERMKRNVDTRRACSAVYGARCSLVLPVEGYALR